MFKKIYKKIEEKSEIFMLIVFYLIFNLLNWISFSWGAKIIFSPKSLIERAGAILLFLTIFLSTLKILMTAVTWINIKPKFKTSEFNKILKSQKLNELGSETISFKYWIEFFIFSVLIISTEYLPFLWTIKEAIKNNPLKLKKNLKNEKISGYYWGKSSNKKGKTLHFGVLTKKIKKTKSLNNL